MHSKDPRSTHLGWIETALRAENEELPHLRIVAQSHYGPPDYFAYIEVHGVGGDRERRKDLQAQVSHLLRQLGYTVKLEQGRDVYLVKLKRPKSAHDRIRMLRCLRAACLEPRSY